jgi:uncharacterized membrane protein
MTKTRLEAFSDGVIAIIITIMVLELKVPHGDSLSDLIPLIPIFVSYVLSFVNVAIYWGNHHHLIHTLKSINTKILWANMNLLFWLSLTPFGTAYMGENHFSEISVALYAFLQLMNGVSYFILLKVITSSEYHDESLAEPLRKQSSKGFFSLCAYIAAIGAAFLHPAISGLLFVMISVMWVVPDRNIERQLRGGE